jgi:hypothetical protein
MRDFACRDVSLRARVGHRASKIDRLCLDQACGGPLQVAFGNAESPHRWGLWALLLAQLWGAVQPQTAVAH